MTREMAKFRVKEWEVATQALADEFVKIYFGEDADSWWVADSIGDVFHVNGYYFNVDNILIAMRFDATFDQLVDYYDLALGAIENQKTIANFENYIKHGITYV